jgi:GH25 family lysozyme M1 (1,4-beta-N-acetylmuramidase)
VTVFGVDCSDFDWDRGPMDIAAMARDGIQFLTHKATEGTRVKHGHYGEALTRARSAGIPILGAYVVPRTPGNNGHGNVDAQVDYFLSYLDQQTPWWRAFPTFLLQVDLEKWGYDAVAPAVGVSMADKLKERTGKAVVLYAPKWAYGDGIGGAHPLWASAYGSNPAGHYRAAYPGDDSPRWGAYSNRTPAILQYGSRLTVGSQSGCDCNAFRGSLDELLAIVAAPVGGASVPVARPEALTAPAYPGHLLQQGSADRASTKRVQQRLLDRGWRRLGGDTLTADGDYGPITKRFVVAFQRDKGLEGDGIVGPATWRALWLAPIT